MRTTRPSRVESESPIGTLSNKVSHQLSALDESDASGAACWRRVTRLEPTLILREFLALTPERPEARPFIGLTSARALLRFIFLAFSEHSLHRICRMSSPKHTHTPTDRSHSRDFALRQPAEGHMLPDAITAANASPCWN